MKKFYQYFPFLSIILIFIIDVSLIFFTHSSWNKSMQELIPMKTQLNQVKNNITLGHLWFEEKISGDKFVDIKKDVFNNFEYEYLKNFTNKIKDKEIKYHFIDINKQLKNLNKIVVLRWNNIDKYGVGSDIDQTFDKIFSSTLEKIDITKDFIDQKIKETYNKKDQQFKYIIFTLIFINLIIFYIFYKLTILEKNHKKRLQEEKDKYKQLMNLSTDMIFIFDLKGNLLDCNLQAQKVLQYDKDELLNLNIENWDKKIDNELFNQFKLKMQKGETIHFETLLIRKDATEVYANIQGKIITIDNKQVIYTSYRDITTIKLLEEQSKLASMGEMIANISHQWRQPLSVISIAGTALMLKKENNSLSDKDFEEFCNAINDNTQYLSQTIDDFRNFIKGDTKIVSFNLKEYTSSFIKLVESSIKNYHFKVILDIEENIEIKGYPNELIQCFMNIFNNSKDAFLQKNIKEEDRYIFITQKLDKEIVTINFKDSAQGIAQDILPRIFEPYFTTKHQYNGTGLGLNMTYKLIVNTMKGSITASTVEYKYDGKDLKGTEFKIILPINKT